MRFSIAADELTGIAAAVEERGHEVGDRHGALAADERDDWAWASESVARDVASESAEQGVDHLEAIEHGNA